MGMSRVEGFVRPRTGMARAFLVGLLAACGGKTTYDPWLTPQQDFAGTVHAMAVVSVEPPDDLEDPTPVEATFDSLLIAELVGAGFRVVSSQVTGDLWGGLVDSVGGYYDPFTGRQDTSKYNPLRRAWMRILREEHGADAVLFPSIVVVDAGVSDWKASWDGTSQRVQSIFSAALRAIAGEENAATTPALSLEVQIEDMDGEVVYVNRGGIEVWEKPASGRGEGYREVPRSELFRDAERNTRAVRLALGSILTGNAVAQGK